VNGAALSDHYYLSCGEEDALDAVRDANRGGGGGKGRVPASSDPVVREVLSSAARLNELDRRCRVDCAVRFGGFHPPPSHRRVLGDLAYLEIVPPPFSDPEAAAAAAGSAGGEVIHVTAVPTGFYVNRTRPSSGGGEGGPYVFDPSPARRRGRGDDDGAADRDDEGDGPCFSHELLDCLLRKSPSLRCAWSDALSASRERSELQAAASSGESPLQALFRVAVRGDVSGGGRPAPAREVDSVILRPSWLVPPPRGDGGGGGAGVPAAPSHGRVGTSIVPAGRRTT